MSVSLSTRAAGQPSSLEVSSETTRVPATRRPARRTFPIGARFPRHFPDPSGEQLVAISSAPIFPIGARFPRRTPAEALAYLAQLEADGSRVAPTARRFPVGARFPLR